LKWLLYEQGLLMLNVHDLERRWLKYKIKRYLPLFTFSIIGLVGIITFITTYTSHTEQPSVVEKNVVVAQATVKPEKNVTKVTTDTKIEVPQNTQKVQTQQENTLVLKPSLQFMNNIEDGLNPYLEDNYEQTLEDDNPLNSNNDGQIEATQDTQTQVVKEPVKQKGSLIISTKKNETDLKDVIRRFKKNKNPALSLFIAKRYYELGKYQKSYNYALITNEINKDIDESWIIFSKSLVKLGQHELAMLTLKSYLKSNKSSQAEILLRKIESGSFR